MSLAQHGSILLTEAHVSEMPVVIKIAEDSNHETFQINDERYLSSVHVPERERDQVHVATESWITFDEEGVRTELAQAFGVGGPQIEALLDAARKQFQEPRKPSEELS